MLNIIHPYTFKIDNDTLLIGSSDNSRERDRNVCEFIKKCLDARIRVIAHFIRDANPLTPLMEEAALTADPCYHILFERKIKKIYTTGGGIPVPDERPCNIDKKIWEWIEKNLTSRKELGTEVLKSRNLVFIGGVLENCVANIAHYCHKNYNLNGKGMFYVPEFCVSTDSRVLEGILPKFEEMCFKPLSPEKAFDLLKTA